MSKVHILLETTTVTEAGDTAGDAVFCQHLYDEAGAVPHDHEGSSQGYRPPIVLR